MIRHTTRRGFTLIELLVVVSIVAILSSVVLVSLNQARNKGENAAIIRQVREYINAIELTYVPNNKEFPWQTGLDLDQYGCLTDTQGGGSGCIYNGTAQPLYPELDNLPTMINLNTPINVVTDNQGQIYDSVAYSSNGQTFRLRYALRGEFSSAADCKIPNTTIIEGGPPQFPGVTICLYESR